MKKYLYLMIFCLFSGVVWGQSATPSPSPTPAPNITANPSWTAPVKRENGDAFNPLTELESYVLRYKKVGTTTYTEVDLTKDKLVYTAVLPAAAYDFEIRACDIYNLCSAWVVIKSPPVSNPLPPGNFKIIITPDRLQIQSTTR
jgi:hypothetical protein